MMWLNGDVRPPPNPTMQRVIWSVTPEQSTSPYVRDIVASIERSGWTVDRLTLRDLLTSSEKIVHIQWPEHVSRGPDPVRTLAKHGRAVAILVALKSRKHHIVLTAHNRTPHGDSDAFDAWFRRRAQNLASAVIVLVPGHEALLRTDGSIGPHTSVKVIPHPIHAPTEPLSHAPAPERRGLVILGLIHPYHRILEFVDAVDAGGLERPVTVAGSIADEQLVATLEERARSLPWLTVRPGYLDDSELTPLLENSAAMVSLQLNPFNSGGPFYSLPRGLPIIMSAGPQADDISAAVGSDWVFGVPNDLHAFDTNALDRWLSADRSAPNLEYFDLDDIAASHIELYELLRS